MTPKQQALENTLKAFIKFMLGAIVVVGIIGLVSMML